MFAFRKASPSGCRIWPGKGSPGNGRGGCGAGVPGGHATSFPRGTCIGVMPAPPPDGPGDRPGKAARVPPAQWPARCRPAHQGYTAGVPRLARPARQRPDQTADLRLRARLRPRRIATPTAACPIAARSSACRRHACPTGRWPRRACDDSCGRRAGGRDSRLPFKADPRPTRPGPAACARRGPICRAPFATIWNGTARAAASGQGTAPASRGFTRSAP